MSDSTTELRLQRERNLLLVAVLQKRWPPTTELREAIDEMQRAHPNGSAILNFIADRDTGNRAAWTRSTELFLWSPPDTPGHNHLGAAHLCLAAGIRTLPVRTMLARLDRKRGDFAAKHNKVVSTVDEAASWLDERLSAGAVQWRRAELREVVATFVRETPLPKQYLLETPPA